MSSVRGEHPAGGEERTFTLDHVLRLNHLEAADRSLRASHAGDFLQLLYMVTFGRFKRIRYWELRTYGYGISGKLIQRMVDS